jgi:hypothetical protein
MKKIMFMAIGLVLAACSPNQTSQAPAYEDPSATAYIDASYPTAQAVLSAPSQANNGIAVRVDRVWIEGKNLNADICFDLPDASDWTVLSASLNYTDQVVLDYATTLISIQDPADGLAGLRCDTLTFAVPPDADLTVATISIDAIGATPRGDDYCTVYLPKIQQTLLERGIGITLECQDLDGAATMVITSKPPEMSQEQAEQIVYGEEFYTVKGPWAFSLSLSQ